ncbi:unnamed protein product [Schistosoma margrebowiei]|uniref:Uncharacterized protein n=1 Tax=Schistosoma margrebowiei TaxID=48269 RepID=A0AA85A7Q4_9TREM|nr:unnamed protein product [Schistosoma margrebowiei]
MSPITVQGRNCEREWSLSVSSVYLATIEREENTLKQSSSSEEVDGKQRSTWLSVISTRFSTQLWHTIHQRSLND